MGLDERRLKYLGRFWSTFGVSWADWDRLPYGDFLYMQAVVDQQVAEERAAEREARRHG